MWIKNYSYTKNGKVCWFSQRAKVGDAHLPAFLFFACRRGGRQMNYERRFFSGFGILGAREGHQP
jgi:hypothetical protein